MLAAFSTRHRWRRLVAVLTVTALALAGLQVVVASPSAAETTWRAEGFPTIGGKATTPIDIDGNWVLLAPVGPDVHEPRQPQNPHVYNLETRELTQVTYAPGLGPQELTATGLDGDFVVGQYFNPSWSRWDPFTFNVRDKTFRSAPRLPAGTTSAATTAADGEVFVGYHRGSGGSGPFMYYRYGVGEVTTWDPPAGYSEFVPVEYDGTWVVGTARREGSSGATSRAAAYNVRTKTYRMLGTLPGHETSSAEEYIDGQVYGTSTDVDGVSDAFVVSVDVGSPRRVAGLPDGGRLDFASHRWVGASYYSSSAVVDLDTGAAVPDLPDLPGKPSQRWSPRAFAGDGNRLVGVTWPNLSGPGEGVVWTATDSVDPGAPKIMGTPKVGSRLTVDPGTWGPGEVALRFRWYRGSEELPETGQSRVVTAEDAGKQLRVAVTGDHNTHRSRTVLTPFTATVARGTLTIGSPTISGTPTVGRTLTSRTGTWGPGTVTTTRQWYRSGSVIAGATGWTYKLTSADRGKRISLKVTGKKSGYTTHTATSASTGTVGPLLLTAPKPTISGTAKVGSTLKVTRGTWRPYGVTLTQQWYRSGVKISGATGTTRKLSTGDRGKRITVKVTGRKSGYTTKTVTSSQTSAVR